MTAGSPAPAGRPTLRASANGWQPAATAKWAGWRARQTAAAGPATRPALAGVSTQGVTLPSSYGLDEATGRLDEGFLESLRTDPDTFRALFPSGSVTGAPKVSTMGLIAGLEDAPRGPYCGAIGYLAPPGSGEPRANFNVAIRTVVRDRRSGLAEFGVGGARYGGRFHRDASRQVSCTKKPIRGFS